MRDREPEEVWDEQNGMFTEAAWKDLQERLQELDGGTCPTCHQGSSLMLARQLYALVPLSGGAMPDVGRGHALGVIVRVCTSCGSFHFSNVNHFYQRRGHEISKWKP